MNEPKSEDQRNLEKEYELKEKLEYINNLKSGYKYTLIEETKEKTNSNIDISDVADIFDINKIEVE
jgi:hypothetical protein